VLILKEDKMTIRYTAVIKDGAWLEVGDRITPGKDPVRFFEMNLKRVGDTTWPAGGRSVPSEEFLPRVRLKPAISQPKFRLTV
jgi:hypothetical protein